jgi:hypothetical protein
MMISVGKGRFIQKTADSDSYKIVVITARQELDAEMQHASAIARRLGR